MYNLFMLAFPFIYFIFNYHLLLLYIYFIIKRNVFNNEFTIKKFLEHSKNFIFYIYYSDLLLIAAIAAARRATGTRYGEQDT